MYSRHNQIYQTSIMGRPHWSYHFKNLSVCIFEDKKFLNSNENTVIKEIEEMAHVNLKNQWKLSSRPMHTCSSLDEWKEELHRRQINGSSRRSWKVRCLYIQNNTVCSSLGSNLFPVFKKFHSSVLFVTYFKIKTLLFTALFCFAFNRNDNEACDDKDHESLQSV